MGWETPLQREGLLSTVWELGWNSVGNQDSWTWSLQVPSGLFKTPLLSLKPFWEVWVP